MKTCHNCGIKDTEGKKWLECPTCGDLLCPNCSQKERKDIETLKEEDAFSRIQVHCPSCLTLMHII